MMRPAVKKRAMRVVVMNVSLARRGRGGALVVVGVVVGRGRGVVLVGVTRTAGGGSMSGVGEVVVVLRLRSDKIGGNSAWEGRWLIYLAGLLHASNTPPPRRTDTQRLPAAVASARDVPGRVDGSEVEGVNSSLGANMIDCYGRTRRQGGEMLGWELSGLV
jgi:hypothetical protein